MARVLVIDDEGAIRRVMRLQLEGAGHQVREAAGGAEALAALEAESADVLIIDIVMPDKGGIETLMEVRRRFAGLKAIMISGKIDVDQDSFRILARQFGALQILRKPLLREDLLHAVEVALD